MDECKATSTPMHQNEKLRKNDEAEKANKEHYRRLVGCLMYHLAATSLDIQYFVNVLSRFMHYVSVTSLKKDYCSHFTRADLGCPYEAFH